MKQKQENAGTKPSEKQGIKEQPGTIVTPTEFANTLESGANILTK